MVKCNKKTIKISAKMIMAIFSLSSAAVAYFVLSSVTQDFVFIVSTFKQTPISNITLASTCPTGYTALQIPFPGTTNVCDCRKSTDNAKKTKNTGDWYIAGVHPGKCDNKTEIQAKCVDLPGLKGKNFTLWRGLKICIERSGTTSFTSPQYIVKVGMACPTGYVNCTGGVSASGYTSCVTQRSKCPISEATVLKNGAKPAGGSAGWVSQYLGDYTPPDSSISSNATLYYRRGAGLPLKWIDYKPGSKCWANGYNAGVTRKDKWMASSIRTSTSCTAVNKDFFDDKRWVTFDREREFTLYDENTAFGTSNNSQSFWMPPDAKTNDWQLLFMTDVKWTDNCPAKRLDVASKESAVVTLKNAQLALFVLLVIVTLVSSLYMNFRDCTAKTEDEAKMWQGRIKKTEIVASIVKTIPVLVALFIAWVNKGWFASVAGTLCSDVSTNATFTFFSDKLQTTSIMNIVTLLTIAVSVILFVYGMLKPDKVEEEEEQPAEPV